MIEKSTALSEVLLCPKENTEGNSRAEQFSWNEAVSALKNDTDKMTLWLWFLMIFWYIHRLVTYSAIMRSFLLRLMGNNTKTHSLTLCKKREVYVCVWWGKHLSLNGKSLANLSSQSSANPADEEAERT